MTVTVPWKIRVQRLVVQVYASSTYHSEYKVDKCYEKLELELKKKREKIAPGNIRTPGKTIDE